jgi:hypothetical protein
VGWDLLCVGNGCTIFYIGMFFDVEGWNAG